MHLYRYCRKPSPFWPRFAMLTLLAMLSACQANSGNQNSLQHQALGHRGQDVIIHNARIYQHPAASAVIVRDGKISQLTNEEQLQHSTIEHRIDANGQLLLPGFIDNHNHLGEGGEVFCLPNADQPLAQQTRLLQRCALEVDDGDWILGYGGALELEMEQPGQTPRQLLDRLFPHNPVVIMDFSSHAQFANSRALAAAGFSAQSPDPQGGVLMRDNRGQLNGILLDNAGDILMEKAVLSLPERHSIFIDGIYYGLNQASKHGITTVGDGRTYWRRGMWQAWQTVANEQGLTVRVSLRPWIYPDLEARQQLTFLAQAYQPDLNQRLIVNQVKMYSDGVPEYGTAKVMQAYDFSWLTDYPNGLNYLSESAIREWLSELEQLGYGAHIHAIGDAGIQESLNAIEQLRLQGSKLKYNLTHLFMMHPDDVPRFAELDVDADIQLSEAAHTREQRAQHITPYIGEQRASQVLHTPVKELQRSGANVVLSSDWTVNPIDPLQAISFAVEEQSLSIDQAIAAYTINAASALGLETITGTIEVGKSADLILLNRDITRSSAAAIRAAQVSLTLLQGEIVFQKK